MTDLNALAVAIAAVAAFVLSASWYAIVSVDDPGATESRDLPPWLPLAEILRSAVVALVVAGLAAEIAIDGIPGGMLLGLVLFLGFPAVLFAGSILHEGYSPRLAALHLGDWLLKLVLIGAVIGAFE